MRAWPLHGLALKATEAGAFCMSGLHCTRPVLPSHFCPASHISDPCPCRSIWAFLSRSLLLDNWNCIREDSSPFCSQPCVDTLFLPAVQRHTDAEAHLSQADAQGQTIPTLADKIGYNGPCNATIPDSTTVAIVLAGAGIMMCITTMVLALAASQLLVDSEAGAMMSPCRPFLGLMKS